MSHVSRSNRNANALRRIHAAIQQQPVPLVEQQKRAEANAAADLRRYPHPPKYRYSYAEPPPVQPLCYEVARRLPPRRLRRSSP